MNGWALLSVAATILAAYAFVISAEPARTRRAMRCIFASWALYACVCLAACSSQRVKPTIIEHTPVEVTRRVMEPVKSEWTAPLPCYERRDDSVREYVTQAETNTASCKTANAHRQAIRDSHPED